jgi:triphosphoribosyl-dephospho-CoA synthetase
VREFTQEISRKQLKNNNKQIIDSQDFLERVSEKIRVAHALMIALHGTDYHVETVVRYFRRVQEAEELFREAQRQSLPALGRGLE